MIRKLDKTEYDRATSLALEVYIQCGAEDFDEEGLNSFKSFIFSEQLMNEIVIYGAFDNENLVGIMGTKNEGKHLSLFFIGKEHHRKGIGKQLFFEVAYRKFHRSICYPIGTLFPGNFIEAQTLIKRNSVCG